MKPLALYPLKFNSIYKDYVWGGKNLRKIGKPIGDDETVAESWELCDLGQDVSIVSNGDLAGRTLRELVTVYGENICPVTPNGTFPVMIKYLDVQRHTSVQVHPDDDYARKHEGPSESGKAECWFIMDTPPGTELIAGLKEGITRRMFSRLIREGRTEEGLNRVPVSRGDLVLVEPGTVHVLPEGSIICEIQQNSDNTYRVYDFGRMGRDGKPRPLHVDKALDVITFPGMRHEGQKMSDIVVRYDRAEEDVTQPLARGHYFNIDRLRYRRDLELSLEGCHFQALNIIAGKGIIVHEHGELPFRMGDTILVPRTVERFTIRTDGVEILKTFL